MKSFLDSLSPTTLALLAILVVTQLSLQIWALVDLSRRAEVQFGRKWLWVIIIIAGNIVGALVYLGFGRIPQGAFDPPSGDESGRDEGRRRAIDDLYGPKR
jgi:hypothetical protein